MHLGRDVVRRRELNDVSGSQARLKKIIADEFDRLADTIVAGTGDPGFISAGGRLKQFYSGLNPRDTLHAELPVHLTLHTI